MVCDEFPSFRELGSYVHYVGKFLFHSSIPAHTFGCLQLVLTAAVTRAARAVNSAVIKTSIERFTLRTYLSD